jgi:hypothetical protein
LIDAIRVLVEFKQHFVAFLDVLGFSEMVRADTENESQDYLARLFRCHQSAANIFSDHPDCAITQFSDSIVVSKPYNAGAFQWFAKRVAEYQRLLLDEGLLCRGGVAVNKHFSNGSFTFSAGLIVAYQVESKSARYPRVVISRDVLDLVFPNIAKTPRYLIEEDDGLFFIDYLGLTKNSRPQKLVKSVETVVQTLLRNSDSSVREKGLWLAAYADSVLNTSLAVPKFRGHHVR